jgi:SanA protein
VTKKRLFLVFAVVAIAWDIGASTILARGARGRLYSEPTGIPYRRVALVLGCSEKLGNGQVNPFFENRIRAAASLYRAHKIDYFLVSGDHHIASYDEPTAMKNHLIADGVPADHIVCDYAGFRTVDSIIRAKKVFGQSRITIISQRFHNERAIFLARHHGIDAIGFDAQDVNGYYSFLTRCRDQGSKMFTLLDVYVLRTKPKFLGPPVSI